MMKPDHANAIHPERAALAFVRQRVQEECPIGLILGSGLGALSDALTDATTIPTGDIPGYPESTVVGHKGEIVVGRLEGQSVAVLRGRVHLYEGHSAGTVTFPVRLLHAMGVRHLVVTNAAGGINPAFHPGTPHVD